MARTVETMDSADLKTALLDERAATVTQLEQLGRDLDDLYAAAADVATDDEHDPEGATIAYERERTKALIEQARVHLGELARALERLANGEYGRCAQCRREISLERLSARPAVRTCIVCASR